MYDLAAILFGSGEKWSTASHFSFMSVLNSSAYWRETTGVQEL